MRVNLSVLFAILVAYHVEAIAFPGVYQLELLDFKGKTMSKATGFKVGIKDSDGSYRKVILTSFHFINARLLEAERIKIGNTLGGGSGEAFSILAYDELNDLLVLDYKGAVNEDEAVKEDMFLSSDCNGNLNVLGYNNDEFHLLNFNSSDAVEVLSRKGLFKIPLYLRKGFSGSPVLNNGANVCGMVALSSEKNANSIALTSRLIYSIIKTKGLRNEGLSIGDLRREMNLEYSITSQAELSRVVESIKETVVVVLEKEFDAGTAFVNNARNLVIKVKRDYAQENVKLRMNNSNNIKIEGVKLSNLSLQGCRDITVLSDSGDVSY